MRVITHDFHAAFNRDWMREPLRRYIARQFPEYNPQQLLLFGLSMEGLQDRLLDQVMEIPVDVEWTSEWPAAPNGHFYDQGLMGKPAIFIQGIHRQRYENDRAAGGYAAYTDGCIFHEMVHAVDWLKGLFTEVAYNPMEMGVRYYSDPEEVRAYGAQMRYLCDFLGIPKGRVLQLMERYTTDPSDARREWMPHALKMAQDLFRRPDSTKSPGSHQPGCAANPRDGFG